LNKIIDYKPHSDELTKVELFQWTDFRSKKKTRVSHTSPVRANIYTSEQYQSQIKTRGIRGERGIKTQGRRPQGGVRYTPQGKAMKLYNYLGNDPKKFQGGKMFVDRDKYNTRGEATRILGSGASKKNKGNILIGQNLNEANENQIVIGKGRNNHINRRKVDRMTSDVSFRSSGKEVASIGKFGLEQGGGDILIDNGSGGLVKMFIYDFNTSNDMANYNSGRSTTGRGKIRNVILDKDSDDVIG